MAQPTTLRAAARPLTGAAGDYDGLLERIGDARFVLIGEASHGTHEFYKERALLTKLLIERKGFCAVALEADWPDSHRVHRYVTGLQPGGSIDALAGFRHRFPIWMWRNADMLDFVGWLRAHNDSFEEQCKVGVYGVDLYSLHASMAAVLGYLDRTDPEAATEARKRYACFDQFGDDPQGYGYAAGLGVSASCETAAIAQLMDLQRRASELMQHDGETGADAYFDAEQNARLVRDSEAYYRAMFHGRASTWNLRDRHMADCVGALVDHLEGLGRNARIVIWAHNSHLGDARATQMGAQGEVNLGELVRSRWPDETVLIGQTTYTGTVTAASDWDAVAERKRVRPALPGSCEALFHGLGIPRFWLDLRECEGVRELQGSLLQRAIGVVYRPQTERMSHYFYTRLTAQFDFLLHFDQTRAVEPLEREEVWDEGELPETWPFGV